MCKQFKYHIYRLTNKINTAYTQKKPKDQKRYNEDLQENNHKNKKIHMKRTRQALMFWDK